MYTFHVVYSVYFASINIYLREVRTYIHINTCTGTLKYKQLKHLSRDNA